MSDVTAAGAACACGHPLSAHSKLGCHQVDGGRTCTCTIGWWSSAMKVATDGPTVTAAGTKAHRVRISYHDGLEYGPAEWRVEVNGVVFSAPTLEGVASTVAELELKYRGLVASAQADLDKITTLGKAAIEAATLRAGIDARAKAKRELAAAREALRVAESVAARVGIDLSDP